jgi:hypothetical protein
MTSWYPSVLAPMATNTEILHTSPPQERFSTIPSMNTYG